jgi:two-component system, oxyanion-binding sensor
MTRIKAGFMPLMDAALLVVCKEKGFAEQQELELALIKESSWANVRDRLSVGQFDCAHMLAPLPIAQNLGLSPLREQLIAPFALGLGGNAISVSQKLFAAMQAHGLGGMDHPAETGRTLKAALAHRRSSGESKPVFAVVHAYSSHAYELRYWLAAYGINPETDIALTIIPPPLMADALSAGNIDGFCVGEPWNSVAKVKGISTVIATKAAIWQSSPEKVLALRESWASQREGAVDRLLVALHHSALWAAESSNREELAHLLSHPDYLGVDPALLLQSLEGRVQDQQPQPDFIEFAARAANFPWQSHALWFYSQMARWAQIDHVAGHAEIARTTYRPDIYRRALRGEAVALPGASSKVEGDLTVPTHLPAHGGKLLMGPDGFFDGVRFDPDRLDEYLDVSPFAALHKK